MEKIVGLFVMISAIATVAIAYFTYQNYNMYKIIQNRDEGYKKQTRELYQAIVISTLLSGPSSYGSYSQCKDIFKKEYRGETTIFRD